MNYNFSSNALDEEEVAGRGGEGGSCAAAPAWARPCDGCRAAPSVVYCHADAAYLCASCDARVHAANRVASRHDRVRVCEACERAPAVLACRADAAALCVVCDAQVHSANPLAGRHQRVPVLPLPVAAIPPAASVLAEAAATAVAVGDKQEEEVDSWLLLTNTKDPVSDNNNNNNCNCSSSNNNNISSSNTSTFYADVDEYFDLVGYNSYCDNHINSNPKQYGMQEQQQQQLLLQKEFGDKEGSEHVVPASQVAMANEQQQSGYGVIGVEQAASMTAGVSAYTDSITNSISFSSSMEVGIVPDNMATTTDMPNSGILLTPAGAISLFSSGSSLQMPLHLTSMDREARVLRYKEKKKSRKFEKTIRYATRKTYAEARPRIKGRFAKRSSDMEIEVDQMFSSAALSSDGSYGTVLWF